MAEIELRDAHLRFRVRQTHNVTLKEYLIKRLFLTSVNPIIEVHALRGIDLHLKEATASASSATTARANRPCSN